jgi:hypothetical protein
MKPRPCNYGFMPKRISKKKQEPDANEIAFRVVSAATTEAPAPSPTPLAATVSQIMADMGRKGGKIGGKRSMETMTKAERKRRAKDAAKARWNKSKRS